MTVVTRVPLCLVLFGFLSVVWTLNPDDPNVCSHWERSVMLPLETSGEYSDSWLNNQRGALELLSPFPCFLTPESPEPRNLFRWELNEPSARPELYKKTVCLLGTNNAGNFYLHSLFFCFSFIIRMIYDEFMQSSGFTVKKRLNKTKWSQNIFRRVKGPSQCAEGPVKAKIMSENNNLQAENEFKVYPAADSIFSPSPWQH